MLDKRSLALLDIINRESPNSGYGVFAFNDIVNGFPKCFDIDLDGVRECLNNLSVREYLSVKYEDEKEFCAMPTPKGRLEFENRMDEEIRDMRTAKKYFLYSFSGGFLGAILAITIAVIITVIIGGGK